MNGSQSNYFRAPDAPHRMLAELPLPVLVTTEDDYLT